MRLLRRFLARIGNLVMRRRNEARLKEEIEAHLALQAEDNIRAGMSPAEARRQATLQFGSVEATKEECRDARGTSFLEDTWRDTAYAARMLRKSPGFTIVAILTLALGIGANTAIFAVLYSSLLRPLPYPHGDRLVLFGMVVPSIESRPLLFASAYLQLANGKSPFESTASWLPGTQPCDLTEVHPSQLACVRAESTFLPTFRVRPILGRNFTTEEDGPNAPNVCLISYGLWQSRFGGSRTAVGKTLSLNGTPRKIIGVLPRTFEWPTLARVDVILPEALSAAERASPTAGLVRAYGRLKPGVTLSEARAQLEPAFENWRRAVPPMFRKEARLRLISVREDQTGSIRLALIVLFGASLALLLLALANVANLLAARGATRERELAIRAALGATRKRLLFALLAESVLLGLGGGLAGTAVTFVLLRLFVGLAPTGIPRVAGARLDAPILLFVLGSSLLSGLGSGFVPALAAKPVRTLLPGPALGKPRGRLGAWLVTAQVALSFVLVIAAGLFLATLRNIDNEPIGIETSRVFTAEVELERSAPGRSAGDFFGSLETRLRGLPGVTGVAISDSLPPAGEERANRFSNLRVEGRAPSPRGTGGLIGWRIVTPDYFHILGIRLLEGRVLVAGDQAPGTRSIVVNRRLAALLFSNEDAIGQRLRLSGSSGPWFTVVGVVGDVRYLNNSGRIQRPDPEYYIAGKTFPGARQSINVWEQRAFFLVESPLKSTAVEKMVRGEIASLDPTLPSQVASLDSRVGDLRVRPRFNAALVSLFAFIGLFLAALGLYGTISLQVSAIKKDIGIRMALGAQRSSVFRLVVRRGLALALAGVGVGAAISLGVTRYLGSLLYGVRPTDPATFVAVPLILVAVALLACYIPARRAMRVDPATALRHE